MLILIEQREVLSLGKVRYITQALKTVPGNHKVLDDLIHLAKTKLETNKMLSIKANYWIKEEYSDDRFNTSRIIWDSHKGKVQDARGF